MTNKLKHFKMLWFYSASGKDINLNHACTNKKRPIKGRSQSVEYKRKVDDGRTKAIEYSIS